MGIRNKSLFIKTKDTHQINIQIFEDDIIFGTTCQSLHDEFVNYMHDNFNLNILGDLKYILDLQIPQSDNGIYISESKYLRTRLKSRDLILKMSNPSRHLCQPI